MSRESERLYDAITSTGDDLIAEAGEPVKKARAPWKKRILQLASAAAVLGIAAGAAVLFLKNPVKIYAAAEAVYPAENVRVSGDETPGMAEFLRASLPVFLGGKAGENRVYSPLNVYMALGMLAETTDGESRAQVLSLLGADSVEEQRVRSRAVWEEQYYTGEFGSVLLASSLWVNERFPLRQSMAETLAREYYASTYRGDPLDGGFVRAFRDWLNEQTRGLLREAAEGIEFDEDTVLALMSTVYFHGRWTEEFRPEDTVSGNFHAPEGDIPADYMKKRSEGQVVFEGMRFTAVIRSFSNQRMMVFFLPREGVTPEELAGDPEIALFLTENPFDHFEYRAAIVNLSVPKFDVSSDLDLADGFAALGVTDVFDPGRADFSPLAEETCDLIFLSRASQAARVAVDEEGCTAASYVMLVLTEESAEVEEEIDFALDRPFLFAVTYRNRPLFTGIVNRPEA